MEKIFQVSASILASIGGAGVLLIGLSSWLGKLWANRILEKEKKKYSEDLENYKNQLFKELEYAKSENQKKVFVSQLQFEKEFGIYIELWEYLYELYLSTQNLFPIFDRIPSNKEDIVEVYRERYSEFADSYNSFSKCLVKYAPFYTKNIYCKLKNFRDFTHNQGVIFDLYKFDDDIMDRETKKEAYNNNKLLKEKIEELEDDVREYLRNLRRLA